MPNYILTPDTPDNITENTKDLVSNAGVTNTNLFGLLRSLCSDPGLVNVSANLSISKKKSAPNKSFTSVKLCPSYVL